MTETEVAASPPRRAIGGRILGIDAARAVAMLGMVIAHYAWPDESSGPLNEIATAVSGRAMPLFVLLGGVGASILAARTDTPDRTLLIRAAVLYPVGLVLQELTTFIAIILQSYGLLFAVAPLLRRLPSHTLLAIAAAVAVTGSWSYQVVGPRLDHFEGPSDLIDNPIAVVWSLLFNGSYPFFPVAAFFIVGLVIGRLDLASTVVARTLAGAGTVVGVVTVIVSNLVQRALDIDAIAGGPPDGQFRAARLLDTTGHSEMLAWVVSATGTSLAVLGASLLITPLLGGAAKPVVALGQLALSFYVFQAILVRFTPHPTTTPLSQEFVTALAIYIGFMAFATVWRLRFRSGPLEAGLRFVSVRRRNLHGPRHRFDR